MYSITFLCMQRNFTNNVKRNSSDRGFFFFSSSYIFLFVEDSKKRREDKTFFTKHHYSSRYTWDIACIQDVYLVFEFHVSYCLNITGSRTVLFF